MPQFTREFRIRKAHEGAVRRGVRIHQRHRAPLEYGQWCNMTTANGRSVFRQVIGDDDSSSDEPCLRADFETRRELRVRADEHASLTLTWARLSARSAG